MIFSLIYLLKSTAFDAQIGYNEVYVAQSSMTTINIESSDSENDIYLVNHNPDYFNKDSDAKLLTIYKNIQSINIKSKSSSTKLMFHIVKSSKADCQRVHFILNYNPTPIYKNLSNKLEDNTKYCIYMLSALDVSYVPHLSSQSANEIAKFNNGDGNYTDIQNNYPITPSNHQIKVVLQTSTDSKLDFGINYIMVHSSNLGIRLSYGPYHINDESPIFYNSNVGDVEKSMINLDIKTDLIPGTYDLEIGPTDRKFNVHKNTFIVFSQTLRSNFKGSITNKTKTTQLFTSFTGGRVIRLLKDATIIISSANYPLLRVTVFDTTHHPYCDYQGTALGMNSYTLASSIPPGNGTMGDFGRFCMFHAYPYNGISASVIAEGMKNVNTKYYDIYGQSSNDFNKPIVQISVGRPMTPNSYRIGMIYDFFDQENFLNSIVSTNMNPEILILGDYSKSHLGVILGVSIPLGITLIIMIVVCIIYRKQVKRFFCGGPFDDEDAMEI